MFEKMVCGVANVGERKYRILAVFIIAVMVSMSAFLMPVQVYAAGEAISVLVGTLAGLITESVAGSALAAAGCAALIPEFAGALIAIAVGFGVTLTVYQLYQCFASWWETSGNVSDFKMVAEAFDKQNNRIIASPFIFASICNIVKSQILGITNLKSDTDSSLPFFENFVPMGQTVFPAGSHSMTSSEPYYTQVFNYKNVKYTDYFNVSWSNSANRFNHFTDLNYNDRIVRISSPVVPDVKLWADDYCQPKSDIFINHYLPVFEKDKAQLINSFYQFNSSNEKVEYSKVQDCFASPVSFIDINNKIYNVHSIDFNSDTHRITFSYNTRAYGLLLKNNEIITEFDSALDFTYKFFYEASALCKFSVIGGRLELSEKNFIKNSTVAKPVERPNILSNYNAKCDVISTTADDINKKIKSGDVTKDTAGSISIGMTPTAVGKLTNTSTAQDVEKVKITDVALPTQVEADKTAKEEAKIDPPGNIGAAFRQGGDMIIDGAMTISDKFPFDVIKCAYEWLQCLIQDGKPIVTKFTINIPQIGSVPVKIDFSQRQDVVTVINWICIVGCGLGLILTSREWLKAI